MRNIPRSAFLKIWTNLNLFCGSCCANSIVNSSIFKQRCCRIRSKQFTAYPASMAILHLCKFDKLIEPWFVLRAWRLCWYFNMVEKRQMPGKLWLNCIYNVCYNLGVLSVFNIEFQTQFVIYLNRRCIICQLSQWVIKLNVSCHPNEIKCCIPYITMEQANIAFKILENKLRCLKGVLNYFLKIFLTNRSAVVVINGLRFDWQQSMISWQIRSVGLPIRISNIFNI